MKKYLPIVFILGVSGFLLKTLWENFQTIHDFIQETGWSNDISLEWVVVNQQQQHATPPINNQNQESQQVTLHLPHENETILTTFYHNVQVMQQQQQQQLLLPPNDSLQDASTSATVTLQYHGLSELEQLSRPWSIPGRNEFCAVIRRLRTAKTRSFQNGVVQVGQRPHLHVVVNVTFSCRELFEDGHLGTGNFLAFFYGLRLSAHVLGNIDLHLACHDAEATQRELILPWTMGYFPGRLSHEPSRYPVSNESACSGFRDLPLSYMYREIQHDLRRMAIALVGIPSPSPPVSPNEVRRRHASASYAQQHVWPLYNTTTNQYYYHRPIGSSVLLLPPPKQSDQPMYETPSEFQMDDVTIHFRCGDFLSDQWDFIETSTFSSYVEPITPNIRSIGILTQSLEIQNTTNGRHQRIDDLEQTVVGRCRILVNSFVAYVQHFHPHVEIRIHNSINETIALTYARMIMARQSSITGMTSFGEFATMATFGTGYIRSPGQWIRPIDGLNATVIWYPAEKIASFQYIKQLWMVNGTQAALQWFWNGAVPRDGNYCGILHRSMCQ